MNKVKVGECMKPRGAIVLYLFAVYLSLGALGQVRYEPPAVPNCSLQTNRIVTCVGCDWMNIRSTEAGYLAGTPTAVSPYTVKDASISIGSPWYVTRKYPAWSSIPAEEFRGLTNISIGDSPVTLKSETSVVGMVISNRVPANVLEVPAGAMGNVQIILESSPDLVHWSAASPGTYGPSAVTNRYFRVRSSVK